MILAGTPIINLFFGTSFVTTAPAPTIEPSPILIEGKIIAPTPIATLSSIIGPLIISSLYPFFPYYYR